MIRDSSAAGEVVVVYTETQADPKQRQGPRGVPQAQASRYYLTSPRAHLDTTLLGLQSPLLYLHFLIRCSYGGPPYWF